MDNRSPASVGEGLLRARRRIDLAGKTLSEAYDTLTEEARIAFHESFSDRPRKDDRVRESGNNGNGRIEIFSVPNDGRR